MKNTLADALAYMYILFDQFAKDYDKARPGYPEELYKVLFDYASLAKQATILEIGIGSGQATLPFLQYGYKLIAVEYGKHFCEICKHKFASYANFTVVNTKFEDYNTDPKSFDLVFSATAFHWLDEKESYPKVYKLLKKGGVFAQFANNPVAAKDNPNLRILLDNIYDKYYYSFFTAKQKFSEFTTNQAEKKSTLAAKYGFGEIRTVIFKRIRTFSAKEYILLLGTYSDHLALPDTLRSKLFFAIGKAINDHGGTISIFDLIDLELAKKPDES